MSLRQCIAALSLLALAANVIANESTSPIEIKIGRMVITESATLNPMEFKLEAMPYQKPSMYVCQSGYLLTKKAAHKIALDVHQKCADAGYTRSMLWLAYIYQNGLYTEENPEMTAYWDKRAADAGNEVGMFNFGVDLLRGYGVGKYLESGHIWIDRAADAGHKHAIELRDANYDLRVITPDADEARWAERR